MFGFIAFGFKLLIAAIIGGALSYIPGQSTQDRRIVETSLICIFGAAILGLTSQFSGAGSNFSMGFGILTVLIVANSITRNMDFSHRMTSIFSAVAGTITGSGHILQAALLSLLIYVILRNSQSLLNYFEKGNTDSGKTGVENISN